MNVPTRIIQLKLLNGESIIGILANIDLQNRLFVLQQPHKIYTGKALTEEGPVTTVAIVPWFEFEPELPVVAIPASQVMVHSFLSRDGEEAYLKILRSEQNPEPPELPGEVVEDEDAPPDKSKMN